MCAAPPPVNARVLSLMVYRWTMVAVLVQPGAAGRVLLGTGFDTDMSLVQALTRMEVPRVSAGLDPMASLRKLSQPEESPKWDPVRLLREARDGTVPTTSRKSEQHMA